MKAKSTMSDYSKMVGRIGLAFIMLLVVSMLASLVSIPFYTINLYLGDAAYGLAYSGFSLGLGYLLMKFLFKDRFQGDMDCFRPRAARSWKMLGAGLIFGLVCFTLVVLPLYLTGQYSLQFNGTPWASVLSMFFLYVGVGFAEEILCRGLMMHSMLPGKKWVALVFVSALFGIMHMANEGVTVNAILGVILAGLVLGMSMYATNSIMFAIGFHITWNWVQGSIYGIAVSGTDSGPSVFTTTVVGTNELITGGAFGAESSLPCMIVLTLATLGLWALGRKNGRFQIYDAPVSPISDHSNI